MCDSDCHKHGEFEKFISNTDGIRLYCRYWNEEHVLDDSVTPCRGLVFICHGFAEHCLYYTEMAKMLIEQGFYVFAHDHVGHGQSQGARAHIDTFDIYVRDIFQHVDKVKKERAVPETLPTFLIGHSMGGLISVLCGLDRPKYFTGVVLLGPALIPSPDAASPLKMFLGRLVARFFPQMIIVKFDPKTLSRDPEVVKKYVDDPLVWHGGVKAKWGLCYLNSLQVVEKRQSEVDWPFITLHGDTDHLCDVEESRKLYEAARSTDKEIKIYKGHYHQLHHEIEQDKQVVLEDIKKWLLKHA